MCVQIYIYSIVYKKDGLEGEVAIRSRAMVAIKKGVEGKCIWN